MRLLTNAAESVTLDHALEALSFGSADRIDELPFNKYVLHSDRSAQLHLSVKLGAKIPELNDRPLGTGPCLFEMTYLRFGGVFLLLLAKSQLDRPVAVCVGVLYLRDHTGAGLNDGAGNVLAVSAEHTGHSYLFSYNSRHV